MEPSDATPAIVNTEFLDPELAKIGWHRFNFPWCTGYPPKLYRRGLDIITHKDTNDFRPHIIQPILLLDIKAKIHNNHLVRIAIIQAETIYRIAPEQYGISKEKAAEIQALNTRIFYNLI